MLALQTNEGVFLGPQRGCILHMVAIKAGGQRGATRGLCFLLLSCSPLVQPDILDRSPSFAPLSIPDGVTSTGGEHEGLSDSAYGQ